MNPTYDELLRENLRLKQEVAELKRRITKLLAQEEEVEEEDKIEEIPAKPKLSLEQKVELFRSFFRGREDVFARRWTSTATGKSGYQPVCQNEWKTGVCDKKKYKCAECPSRQLKPLDYNDFYQHLAGKDFFGRDVIGMYPIREDDTCFFLCADFDDKSCKFGYKDDVLAYFLAAKAWQIDAVIERSRSGNGAHVWIFFEEAVPASKARKLGNALLNEAMKLCGKISFASYDRLFPNQDTLSEGGFGNLIALPLQGMARRKGNSVFVDEYFEQIPDQWGQLQETIKLTNSELEEILHKHNVETDLGKLSTTSEQNPWETPKPEQIYSRDFAKQVVVTRANMLYVPLSSISTRVLNHLKRIAAFRNPDFYTKRAMHFSTHNVPRIISCSEISEKYLALPRGCEDALVSLLLKNEVKYSIKDKTNAGHPISVGFKGTLRLEQVEAINILAAHNNGILHATTVFGKTVAAIGLIAEKKVNTLILVHTKALLDQWKDRLENFLEINFSELNVPAKRGRKKQFSPFGTLDSNGNSLHGQVDIALIQSCLDDGEVGVKDFVNDYGMVIVDECHHIPAAGFEQVLRSVKARYVYGLTATPTRKDGHQPIIFMQCGPIRYTADAKQQIASQTFSRVLIPRFTTFRFLNEDKINYSFLVDKLTEDEKRNELIVNDAIKAVEDGRTPIILTTRTKHVELLSELIKQKTENTTVVSLIGSEKTKEKREKMAMLNTFPADKQLIIIATGKYVGEGFDYPRLDTLLLVSPVSWKGIVQQYAGRLHREHDGKQEVRILDYVDIHVPLAELMYRRRMNGYAGIGYKVATSEENSGNEIAQSIFSGNNYFSAFLLDIKSLSSKSIAIVLPKIWLPKSAPLLGVLYDKLTSGTDVAIFTQHENNHIQQLRDIGMVVNVTLSATISCAIIDASVVWYGAVNYLAEQKSEDYAIRINDLNLAAELMEMLMGD